MMAVVSPKPLKPSTDNVIELVKINGTLVKKPEVRYNKDGSIDKRQPHKVAGKSSEVYPFATEEDIRAMINVFNQRIEEAPTDTKRWVACRNKMLFLIGINLGIRISDLISLRWNFFLKYDMTFKDYYKIQPKKTRKSGKFVTLYFNEAVQKAIADYVEQYPIEDMDGWVFKSREGDGAITEKSVWRIIVDTAKKAGIEYNVGTHSLRKTFGYWVYHRAEDKSNALIILQSIFSHSSPAMTSKYIGLTNEEIGETFNNLNLGIDLF